MVASAGLPLPTRKTNNPTPRPHPHTHTDTICQLAELLTLDAENCQLDALPRDLGKLRKLRRLNLRNNRLTTAAIPVSLHSLTQLTHLYLS